MDHPPLKLQRDQGGKRGKKDRVKESREQSEEEPPVKTKT